MYHQQTSVVTPPARFIIFTISLLLLTWFIPQTLPAQSPIETDFGVEEIGPPVAPVKIDGHVLFHVRGISSYPAEKRAEAIRDRISKAAANYSISPDSVFTIPSDDYLRVFAGSEFIMNIYNVDAEWEQVDKTVLSRVITENIRKAIVEYRDARSKPVLIKKSLYALGALALLSIILFIFLKLIKKLNKWFETRIKAKIDSLESKSFKLISSGQLWKSIHVLTRTLRVILTVIIVAVFLNYILSLFPWTNSITAYTLQIFTDPIIKIGKNIINFLPSLAFLIIIFFLTRYILRLTKLLFSGIEHGGIVIRDFDADWAMPTFRIIRVFVIAFAVVIAYPYIPGSETSAFKGVSVFIGILISLGSSSFIGNVIAGYSMTYRRAFKLGDRIKVDDIVGFVVEQKLLVTRLKSVKNEEIVIPNSVLLNSNIINYNTRSKDPGLILHTTVGIGYETPWRLVDSMLKQAADRTAGLMKEPKPFVLMKNLGDFAVTYEINAYCNDVKNMYKNYTLLHQNILDIFNENDVQIMTPAYEGDPEIPKIVPKSKWETPLSGTPPQSFGS